MGKNKYIESPEEMWMLFQDYAKHLKENPILINEQVKGKLFIDAAYKGKIEEKAIIQIPTDRPLTMAGFEVYAFETVGCVNQYFDNADKRYDEYITICSHIRKVIRQNQIEGGMAGVFNPSITQRLNGLADKQEVKTDQPTEMQITVVKGKK